MTLAAALADVLKPVLGDSVTVTGLTRLSAGASRETWAFEADGRALVLRRDPPAVPDPLGMRREAECFRAAAAAGVPIPALLAAGADDAIGSPYLLMERIEGETLPQRLLREERWAAVRPRLPRLFGEILGRIHGIDPAAVPSLEHVPDRLGALVERHAGFGEARPALELVFRWLREHRPEPVAPAVVHGDFRNGNILVDDTGPAAVLDWELAHVGDPREDLGWMCARAWRFGAEPAVGGFGAREELFAGYEAATGLRPDPAAVHWWEVFACAQWAVICRIQSERHLGGTEPSVEMAVLGRRIAEAEHDALLALGLTEPVRVEDPVHTPAPPAETPLYDRPTVDELLAAVTGFLRNELETEDPRTAYLAKVA
ncbi:phosphotransferase family protein, partial [Pseudonocardia pini]|uniref:phosphotransferase family protein n=1 Tax=Pseudonocardia pini TaxID=2758030 RepID=UPI0015F0316D